MKKRALALILTVATAMAMLTACGGSTGASTSTEPAAASTEAAAVEADAAEVGEPVESTIYPTPEGVSYTAIAEGKSAPDWTEYEALIKEIKTTTDMENRVALMHKAEDILMGTAAVIPIYYYNDLYLQKTDVEGIYSNLFGFKFFQFATCPRDVLKINLASEPAKVDPALNSSVDGACLAVNMFEGLYTYDAEGQLQPALAESTEVSEDGMTYTFTLRDGLKWSDGTDLTAKDFEYAWKRAAAPETGADYGYMFDAIAHTEDGALDVTASEDGKTLTVKLVAPCAYFLDLAAFPAYLPVPQAQVEAAEGWETNPGAWAAEAGFVTNGAYTMTAWTHEESMVLTKNDNYWRADEVTIPEIDLMLSADDTAILSAYNAGNLDFADTVPTNEIASLMGNEDFHVIDNLGTYYAAFNVNSPIFDGKTVDQAIAMRKAFAILIDRPYIVETVGQTGQKVATSYIPAGMADGNGGTFKENGASYTFPVEDGYYPEEVQDAAVEEAKALLEYAGYKFDGDKLSAETPINITYLTNDGTGHIGVAQIMQQDFAEIGINMTIWLADFNDPINMLEMWTSDSGNNDCQFGR